MVKADAFQLGQRGAVHARGPGEVTAIARCADQSSPDPRRNAVRLQAAETGNAGFAPAAQPIQPPFAVRLGHLGSFQPRIGRIEPVWWAPRARRRAVAAGSEPPALA